MIPFMDLFTLVFVAGLVISLLSIIVIITIIRRLGRQHERQVAQGTSVAKEREILREIVKIRCPYCSNLYDEKYDNCPYCGGKRKP